MQTLEDPPPPLDDASRYDLHTSAPNSATSCENREFFRSEIRWSTKKVARINASDFFWQPYHTPIYCARDKRLVNSIFMYPKEWNLKPHVGRHIVWRNYQPTSFMISFSSTSRPIIHSRRKERLAEKPVNKSTGSKQEHRCRWHAHSMNAMERTCPVATRAHHTWKGRQAILTLKPAVAWNHRKSH